MIRKHWKRNKRRIVFCLIYPVLAILAMVLYAVSRNAVESHPVVYGLCVFGMAAIIVLLMAVELVKRKWKYQLQGDKLKIREKEGIEIEQTEGRDKWGSQY